MGWFNKNEEEKKYMKSSLPDLPVLPNILPSNLEGSKEISQLPSFPNNSFAEKFSQNTIKDAITGRKEVEEEGDDLMENQMMSSPPSIKYTSNFPEIKEKTLPLIRKPVVNTVKKEDLIFVRLDKFEESLNNFEDIKKQVVEIEKLLKGINEIREKENKELENWEQEIKLVKTKIEKIDEEIFSKIN
jgi:CRISPR/Cas system CSM-associated protein Csm4 (group 5 of RAMP superfamily)